MARKKLTISKWYGGMSNDPSVWGVGSFFDGRGIDVRKDSKKVKLASNYQSDFVLNSRGRGYAVWAIIPSSPNNVYATKDGRLENFFSTSDSYGGYYVDSTHSTFHNCFQYAGTSDFGVVVSFAGILRWPLSTGDKNLGTLLSSVVTEGSFDSATGWTVWANWTVSGGNATHVSGSTATLQQALTVDTASKYVVNVSATVTAGTCAVSLGGSSLGTLSTSTSGVVQTYARTTAGTSETLVFTPSTDFVGFLSFAYVQKSTVTAAITKSFNEQAPILAVPNFIYVGNGNVLTKIDTSLSTWSSTDPVTIAQWYSIRSLTKIGDQIFIYASDGSNGKQYLWDGTTGTPSSEITWYDKPIQRVFNLNNVDYAIVKTSLRSSLYVVNGYQPQLVFQSLNVQDSEKDRFAFDATYVNSIETIGERLLIPTPGWFYTYGSNSPGFPKACVKEFTWNGGVPRTAYYSESAGYNLYSFYSSTKSGSFKNYVTIAYLNEEANGNDYSITDPGYLRTHPFTGTTYGQRKASETYKLGVKIPTGTSVNLYSRADRQTGFATFYTEGTLTVIPTVGAVYSNNGNSYTVTAVTSNSSKHAILHCTYTGTASVSYSWTLGKTSGTGDASVNFFRSNEFKLLKTFTSSSKWGNLFKHSESYNEIEWIVELLTTDNTKTPELYDFEYVFGDIETDN